MMLEWAIEVSETSGRLLVIRLTDGDDQGWWIESEIVIPIEELLKGYER
jgi:hypothetical protein